MHSDLLLAIMLCLLGLAFALSVFTVGWFACMIYFKIDPSGLYLFKAIYGTI
jgi:hypothetical protein